MGLDGVELVLGFEEAFGIAIPDDVAVGMITPRHTIDFVASRLATTPAAGCLTQQLFYQLRRGIRRVRPEDLAVRPATAIARLTDKRDWPGLWSRIRDAAGGANWPERIPWKGWLTKGPRTLRELTAHVAMHQPPPDPSRGDAWTRERIEWTVRRVVWDVLGVRDFRLDDQYLRDLGVD